MTDYIIDLHLLRRLYEFGLPFLFTIVAIRSLQRRGLNITIREFTFGFILTQTVELIAVGIGRYSYPDWLIYFPPVPAWVPLGIGLGWAALCPCVMRVSERILGERSPLWRLAALDGMMAVGVDLILDPAVSGEPLRMWVWSGEGMYSYRFWILNVPVFNFVGWFLLIGACSLELRAVSVLQSEIAKWKRLAKYLMIDLLIAFLVMMLPW